jgi:ADP-ribose pyrophosphatase YjhB (NUDIX family)
VLKQGDRLLLVQHRKADRSYWLLPGGGVQLGETLKECLEREFLEELNVGIVAGGLLFVVETASEDHGRILQPTFSVSTSHVETLKMGTDQRVVGYDFFATDALDGLVIYPDIIDELREYVRTGRVVKKYLQKKWLD